MASASSKPSFKTSSAGAVPSKMAASASSSLSSHLAMVELKSRILAALAKLSDRDTHQIAVEDLEKIIRTLPSDGVPMLLNALLHDPPGSIPSPQDLSGKSSAFAVARRESVRLLALFCSWHADAAAAHLPKIIAHVVRRLKDPASDSSVRDACRDAFGALSALYLRPAVASASAFAEDGSAAAGGSGGSSPVVGLFVKPLFEAMVEQNKVVQGGAAMCMAKVVDCAGDSGEPEEGSRTATGALFQKLCPRICKLLGGQGFLAKGSLLSVVSSLSQTGAISAQSMQQVLQTVRECLESSDWATRKAAANTLCVMASQSSHLVGDGAAATVAALEASRFDKIKPVRDSMMEALVLWKKIAGNGEDVPSADSRDVKNSESIENEEKIENKRVTNIRKSESLKNPSLGYLPPESDSSSKGKGSNIPEKAVVLLKKKAPTLTDKDLNPEFFQKLETRISNDLTVEVVVPRKCAQSSQSKGEEETEASYSDYGDAANHDVSLGRESMDTHEGNSSSYQNTEKQLGQLNKIQDSDDYTRDKWTEQRGFRARESKLRGSDTDDRFEVGQKDLSPGRLKMPRVDALTEGSFSKGNFSAIQRQLTQLERQQASLMNMLQDFMGGSHDSMITLENRVLGLERIVEEMARDLAISSGRRGGNSMLGYDNSPGRSSSRYNGLHDYGSSKFGRGGDARFLFSERFLSSDSIVSGVRGRDTPWRSDSEAWGSYAYPASRNSIMNSRRGYGASVDGRLPRNEYEIDQVSGRRAWDKAQGPFRFGEGPSARSVWQASKDEATLEAIRVAGEDNGTSRAAARVAIPELDAEALTDDNPVQDKGPLWASWTRAMDLLHVGDVDSAYAEILSTGDDLLLVKLMDKSGPVIDQLSSEVASEVLLAVGQFLMEQSLFDIALSWLQQLADLVVENGADYLGIPLEWKREVLLNLHEVASIEPPEDWEGAPPDQLMMHLASAWDFNIRQLIR